MKKCVYAVCALLWAGCTASRSASGGSKDREQKETVQIDSLAPNPFIRHIYTADPSAHVWADGRLYVYASHDIDPPRGCDLMDQYHVFSTDDMVHWTDHGEILRASQVPWGRKEGGFMWAPDCAYKDGTYYFYFPHPSGTYTNDSWKIGVATSKEPAANFTVQGYIEGLDPIIDPCVFVDDDGQAYLYQGGGGTCKGGRLKDNMMEIDGAMQTMEGLVDFHEATWVHKYNGKYYLSYSDNHNPGQEGVEGYNPYALCRERPPARAVEVHGHLHGWFGLFHQPWFHRGIQGRMVCFLPFDSLVRQSRAAFRLRGPFVLQSRRHHPHGRAAQVRRTLVKSGGFLRNKVLL